MQEVGRILSFIEKPTARERNIHPPKKNKTTYFGSSYEITMPTIDKSEIHATGKHTHPGDVIKKQPFKDGNQRMWRLVSHLSDGK